MAKILIFSEATAMEDKSIKINALAHKALELLKADEGIALRIFASVAVIEAIEKDYPHVYAAWKEWALRNGMEEEAQELEAHDLRAS